MAVVNEQYHKHYMGRVRKDSEEESVEYDEPTNLLHDSDKLQSTYYLIHHFRALRPAELRPSGSPNYVMRIRRASDLLVQDIDATQPERLGLCLAVVNCATLFDRDRVDSRSMRCIVAAIQRRFIDDDRIGLDMHSKLSVATHVGMNLRTSLADRPDCAWLFTLFETMHGPLMEHFNRRDSSADITLDLVAEIVTCYYYANRRQRAYEQFVHKEVARKYGDSRFTYRYYAHVDFPSDHEAISLYHMALAKSFGFRLGPRFGPFCTIRRCSS
jgi:hypothetical protein